MSAKRKHEIDHIAAQTWIRFPRIGLILSAWDGIEYEKDGPLRDFQALKLKQRAWARNLRNPEEREYALWWIDNQ